MAGEIDVKEIVWKIYEKIVPNLGLAVAGPQGALAASAMVVSTWLLLKLRGALRAGKELDDEAYLVKLYRELEEARSRLEEARQAGAPEEAVKALEHRVKWLEEEYNLVQVRIAARDSLATLMGEEAVRKLDDMVVKLSEGKEEALGEIAELLAEVERLWRRRELEAQALKRLLEAPQRYY